MYIKMLLKCYPDDEYLLYSIDNTGDRIFRGQKPYRPYLPIQNTELEYYWKLYASSSFFISAREMYELFLKTHENRDFDDLFFECMKKNFK